MFEKHLRKSDILSKDGGYRPASLLKRSLSQVFFKHFTSKNQLPGFHISETLVKNELKFRKTVIFKDLRRKYFPE